MPSQIHLRPQSLQSFIILSSNKEHLNLSPKVEFLMANYFILITPEPDSSHIHSELYGNILKNKYGGNMIFLVKPLNTILSA